MTAQNESYLNIGDATIDLDREERCGFSEVIYGESKTADAIERIALAQIERNIDVLATRVSQEKANAILPSLRRARREAGGVLQPGGASDSRTVAASSRSDVSGTNRDRYGGDERSSSCGRGARNGGMDGRDGRDDPRRRRRGPSAACGARSASARDGRVDRRRGNGRSAP